MLYAVIVRHGVVGGEYRVVRQAMQLHGRARRCELGRLRRGERVHAVQREALILIAQHCARPQSDHAVFQLDDARFLHALRLRQPAGHGDACLRRGERRALVVRDEAHGHGVALGEQAVFVLLLRAGAAVLGGRRGDPAVGQADEAVVVEHIVAALNALKRAGHGRKVNAVLRNGAPQMARAVRVLLDDEEEAQAAIL